MSEHPKRDRAVERAQQAPSGIGAVYDRDVTAHDRDGWQASVVVADTAGTGGAILVAVYSKPGVHAGMEVRGDVVAALVEEFGRRLPAERRFEALQDATSNGEETPGLRLDEQFPELWKAILA